MTYLSISNVSSFEQGDIFKNLPKFSQFIDDDKKFQAWNANITQINNKKLPSEPLSFEIYPKPTMGILLNQDCDIERAHNLVFAEIKKRNEKFSSNLSKSYNSKLKIVRDETRFHYLPPWDPKENEIMPWIVDFLTIFLVPIGLIKNNINQYYVTRLNPDIKLIFKDKISRFFTRLPFEDLIFLNPKERLEYKKDKNLSDEEFKARNDEINSKKTQA